MKTFIHGLWAELCRIAEERKGLAAKLRDKIQKEKQSPHGKPNVPDDSQG